MAARLKTRYLEEIRPALIERFGYSTPMQAPRIEKITVNMGVGDAKQDSKVLEAAIDQLATIPHVPVKRRGFDLQPVGKGAHRQAVQAFLVDQLESGTHQSLPGQASLPLFFWTQFR